MVLTIIQSSIQELRKKLSDLAKSGVSEEDDHKAADQLLLNYIDDAIVSENFKKIDKWYS